MKASRTQTLTLPVAPEEARNVCGRAIASIGCDVGEEGGRLVGHERPDTLCCHIAPVQIDVDLEERPGVGTTAQLEFTIPGRGPVHNRQLRDRMRALGLAVVRELDRRASEPTV